MYITLADLLKLGASVTNDPEGINPDAQLGVLSIGYLLFLTRFDRLWPEKRLKSVNLEYEAGGIDLSAFDGNSSNDLFEPYDLWKLDSDGEREERLFALDAPTEKSGQDSTGYFCAENRLYLIGYEAGDQFRLRYLPEPPLFLAANTDTKVFFPPKFIPFFAKWLAAMQDSTEEEKNRTGFAELAFEEHFAGMEKVYGTINPIVISHGEGAQGMNLNHLNLD